MQARKAPLYFAEGERVSYRWHERAAVQWATVTRGPASMAGGELYYRVEFGADDECLWVPARRLESRD